MPRPSAIALILANFVPLVGVLWFDWQVLDVLLLYWAENVVIGVVNVLRMLATRRSIGFLSAARESSAAQLSAADRHRLGRISSQFRWFLVPFFAVHYGVFCWGHYTAVVSLFGRELRETTSGLFGISLAEAWQSPLWLGVAAIAGSHLVSFFFNFIGDGEYKRTDLRQLMQRPYGRIIALHIAVIAGGFLITVSGNATWMLLVLIIAKSVIDLRMHERERAVFAAGEPVG